MFEKLTKTIKKYNMKMTLFAYKIWYKPDNEPQSVGKLTNIKTEENFIKRTEQCCICIYYNNKIFLKYFKEDNNIIIDPKKQIFKRKNAVYNKDLTSQKVEDISNSIYEILRKMV